MVLIKVASFIFDLVVQLLAVDLCIIVPIQDCSLCVVMYITRYQPNMDIGSTSMLD